MKKIIPIGLAALLFIFGIMLVSCGPIFDIGDVNGGNEGNGGGVGGGGGGGQTLPPIPSQYKNVKATDWIELEDYLQSDEASYDITLEMDTADIYLQRNISIVKPMKITGSSGTMYKIHSATSTARYFCLDLQADLELQDCGFIGYAGTSNAAGGIMADSPPINIRPGNTLTMMGNDAVLDLRDIGSGVDTRTGSQVKLADGASIADGSTGDLLFKAGVEKLIVIDNASVKNRLTVGSGAILQIEKGGELRVGSGATLTIDESIKELCLEGNIVVDRIASPVGTLFLTGSLDSVLARITGGTGSLRVENGIPEEQTKPFVYGANTLIRLNSDGISLGKMDSSDPGGIITTNDDLIIPKGKKLVVGAGIELGLENALTLKGGILDVAATGTVDVYTENGQIILEAENRFEAIPRGSVDVKSGGIITINRGGMFKDEFLELTPAEAASSVTIESGQVFKLSGGIVDLKVTADDASLTGKFTVKGGATLTVSGNLLTVKTPNRLVGENITTDPPPNAPCLNIANGSGVLINAKPIIDGPDQWEWKQQDNQWDWYQ